MLPGVNEKEIDRLCGTDLQFEPDYYRIVDLSKVEQEENKEEGYGLDAQGANNLERKSSSTQPKLSFPISENEVQFPAHLLAVRGSSEKNTSSSGDKSSGAEQDQQPDEVDNWLTASQNKKE
jgi:hypothetical protein